MGANELDVYRTLILEAEKALLVAVVLEMEGVNVAYHRHLAHIEILVNRALINLN
jgi:hypothetical protein